MLHHLIDIFAGPAITVLLIAIYAALQDRSWKRKHDSLIQRPLDPLTFDIPDKKPPDYARPDIEDLTLRSLLEALEILEKARMYQPGQIWTRINHACRYIGDQIDGFIAEPPTLREVIRRDEALDEVRRDHAEGMREDLSATQIGREYLAVEEQYFDDDQEDDPDMDYAGDDLTEAVLDYAFRRGQQAQMSGSPLTANPYNRQFELDEFDNWNQGWKMTAAGECAPTEPSRRKEA